MKGNLIMNSDSIKKAVLDMKETILNDLHLELEEEMSKPSGKRDYQKIAELTEAIHDIDCENDDSASHYEETKNAIMTRLENQKTSKKKRLRKLIAVAAACCFVLIGINIATFSTLGLNMFQAIYKYTKGGITVDINRSDEIILPTTEDDPYGIKTKCAEYDIYPQTPSYIPDDFYLTGIDYDETEEYKALRFFYKKETIRLNIDFTEYNEGIDFHPLGIPTDTYNVSEEMIEGHNVYILKEDNQFTAAFLKDNIGYLIFAEYLDYDTCYKTVESLLK